MRIKNLLMKKMRMSFRPALMIVMTEILNRMINATILELKRKLSMISVSHISKVT